MADKEDLKDILDNNVGEVKEAIKNLKNPDYEELLKLEQSGKDRKTVKEFLETKIGERVEKASGVIKDIEKETSEGLLGSFSRNQILGGGLVLGLVIGLLAGFGANMSSSPQASPAQAEQSVQTMLDSYGFNGSAEFVQTTQQHGMYVVEFNTTVTQANETQESSNTFYVSKDGELLFPQIQSPYLNSPIRVSELEQRAQAQQQAQ